MAALWTRGSGSRLLLTVLALVLLVGCCCCSSEGKRRRGRKCGVLRCSAGQKCVQKNGEHECVCRKLCRLNRNPVCGTDGRTYINHCELHRTACVEKRRISILYKSMCPGTVIDNSEVKEQHIVEKRPQLDKVENGVLKPLVCYQQERDELRQLIMNWLKQKSKGKQWLESGKTYSAALEVEFLNCDRNGDHMLNSDEFLRCNEKNKTIQSRFPEHMGELHILRGLCIDAVLALGDRNGDWLLNKKEFKKLMNPDFIPPKKDCSLEGKQYKDGAETEVSCNLCVCACGNWVCTGTECPNRNGVPGVIRSGHLPSRKERKILLKGFEASKTISIRRMEHEVSNLNKEKSKSDGVDHFMSRLKKKRVRSFNGQKNQ